MADEMNKDVLAARIKIDASKILPAFKEIDASVKLVKDTFGTLNREVLATEQALGKMSKTMDKVALTSDERRQKILAESQALVAQRTAQAELLQAKTKALDTTNQVVEAKLQAQQAIVKKREDAIEQQEKQHQQRMATLQQKTAAAGGQENLIQTKIDRQFQEMKNADARLEMEAERHAARMNQLSQSQTAPSINQNSLLNRISDAALHATIFQGMYAAINEAQHLLKVGLVDIEANMAGYVQTNEHYFVSFNEGSKEMVMNTQRLNQETTNFIHTAHDLGANILDVTESARLWGRMYKDVGVVQEMVRQSTKLSTVDMVGLQDATKMMESVMAQYGVQIHNVSEAQLQGNRVLDSWSSVAHNTMAPAKELGAAFERTGKIASETGVSFDFMNGLISAGIRSTALGGANLGNMWKTVLGTIRSDKAVTELERLGVATKKTVDGVEEWRKAEDILLDLSVAVIDKNYDLTKSFQDISRGVFQFAKLAASINVGDILLGESASINSSGSTMQYLKVQMDTIERKAASTRASLLEIFSTAGDDGLRKSIKDVLDAIDQLLIGLTKVPKGVYEVTAGLGALLIAYRLLNAPIMTLVTAIGVLTAAKTAETVVVTANTTANEVNILSSEGATLSTVQRTAATEASIVATAGSAIATEAATVATVGMTTAQAASAVTMALATAGLSLLAGAAMVWVYYSGQVEKQEREKIQTMKDDISAQQQMISQMQRQEEFIPKLVNAHNQLQSQYDKLTESAKTDTEASKKQIEIKGQLEKVSQALTATVKSEGLAQLQAAGYTAQAIQIQVDKIKEAREQLRLSNVQIAKSERDEIAKQMRAKADEVGGSQQNLDDWVKSSKLNPLRNRGIDVSRDKIDEGVKEVTKLEQQLREKELAISEMEGQPIIDKLAGEQGKRQREIEDIEKDFDAKRAQFTHMVNRKEDGYITAADQEEKLRGILSEYKDKLAGNDKIESLIDDIARTDAGHGFNAKGFGSGQPKEPKAFQFPLNDIDNQAKQAKELVDSASSLIDFYNAKQGALGQSIDDSATRVELYTNKQNKLHEANESLRGSLLELSDKQQKLNNLYDSGKITLDEYNKFSEEITTRTASLTKEVDANSIAWFNEAKVIREVKDQQLKDSIDFSEKWISHEKATRDFTAKEELDAWLRIQDRLEKEKEATAVLSDLKKKADEQVYAARKAFMSEDLTNSEKWIAHEKTAGQLALQDEITAWERVQGRYLEGTDQRKKAEEQLYATKKSLLQEQEKDLDELVKKQKSQFEDAKKAELDKIKEAKDEYTKAQDEKIRAIDRLKAKEQDVNEDKDYNTKLAEENKNVALYQSAVSAEGKKKLEEATKSRDKLVEDHTRVLRNRDLDAQKQALEDEKRVKEDAYQEQQKAVEKHYDDLLKPLDRFKNDVEGRAEALKGVQVTKESEKNTEILKNLDTFITQYQEKMTKINQTSSSMPNTDPTSQVSAPHKTQKDLDLEEYNRNKDLWEQANKDSDTARMDMYRKRNDQIRNKYGVVDDTGKLQHFSEGGIVKGLRGSATQVIAHPPEMILNEGQQSNLFKLLNFAIPKINFSMPSFAMASGSSQSVVNHYQYDVSTGDVNIDDQATARTFWSERDSAVRRFQSRSGGKQR